MSSTVSVLGTATVPAHPDEVEVALSLSYVDTTAEAALAEVSERSQRLQTLFEELSIERDRWSTSGISVREHTEWDRTSGEQVHRGFMASNRLAVRLRDALIVGRLMNEATRRTQAGIDGPWWRIAPDNPARIEACRLAAIEARRKAEGYASGLDVRVGAVMEITEPGVSIQPPRPMMQARAMKALAMDAAPEVDVHAGSLEVSATVIVTFAFHAR